MVEKKSLTKPIILHGETKKGVIRLLQFKKKKKQVVFVDFYKDLVEELCEIRHPALRRDPIALKKKKFQFLKEHRKGRFLEQCGTWVYFPWLRTCVHFLEESLHHELHTSRNKNLITAGEQRKYANFSIAIAGLSVGSHAALTIAMQGGGHIMHLADPDIVSGSNLNRIRLGFDMVGANKTTAVAQQIYQINPYAKLFLYPKGISIQSLKKFLTYPKKIDILIDEMDDILLKIFIRQEAKRLKIPVIMATDNGDGILLDVERFDINPNLPILHGSVEGISRKKLESRNPTDMAKIIDQMIGPREVSKRMSKSVGEIGKNLYSWPQLGGAAQMAGVALAYAARMIATGGPLKTGKTKIALEKILSFNKLI